MAAWAGQIGFKMTPPADHIRFQLPAHAIEGRRCWNCRHYERPTGLLGIDVDLGSICKVDWDRRTYRPHHGLAPGEKYMNPDDSCDKFDWVTLNEFGADAARVTRE